MNQIRRVLLIALALLLIVLPTLAQTGSTQTSGLSSVRFVHAIPGASAIDIYTDDQLTISSLDYGKASNYIAVTPGSHHLKVTQSGNSTSLWEQDITPTADAALTLVASSASAGTFQVFQDDLNSLPLGKARFTAIHAIADGPSVDILLSDGRPVIPGLQYNQPYGTLDLPATSYSLAVVPAGQPISSALVPAQPYNLSTGTSYMALVYGTKDAPQALLLSAPTRSAGDGGYVRFAHTIPGAGAVDVYVNNTLAVPSLAFGDATSYIAMPTASYNISVRAPGGSSDLATSTLDVAAGSQTTAMIVGNAEAPQLFAFNDVISAVNATTSVLSVVNASAKSTVTASTADGTSLLGSIDAGKSDSALLQPSSKGINVTVTTNGTANNQTLDLPGGVYGGDYYSAVAVDGANGTQVVQLPAVSLAQSVASAPGAEAVAASQPSAEATVEAAQPTEVVLAPTATLPAAAPTDSGVQIQAQPTTVPTTTGPTARVLLDPGVNLQLRQYPNKAAFSLGLAPSGSVLQVNGRAGAPIPAPDTTATPLPPEATPFVDAVTLLQDNEDLTPADTWVNVTYSTPDGGTITAWVNAVYVGLRDAQGRSMRLRDLPTVPSNKAGEAQNTSIQPPTARENVTLAIATNVDPGVRVHIRRQPSDDGESLALVPGGTQLELVGVNEKQDWIFVRYTAPDSTVTGWVSVAFVTLQRNSQAVDFARLQELNELTTVGDDQRGTVISSGQATAPVATELRNVVAGTVTGLNSDANLHLRRTASDQGESLALLPNGTTMTVSGRSEDSTWLQVSYQNQSGWVSSQYVTLTFNQQPYEIATLPVVATQTATPSPTPTSQG